MKAEESSRAAKIYEQFSTTTVIRIFNFIRTSQFAIEKSFWITTLLVFSSLTGLSVYQTLAKYASEPTVTQVTFKTISRGSSLNFVDANVCMRHSANALLGTYESELPNLMRHLSNIGDICDY